MTNNENKVCRIKNLLINHQKTKLVTKTFHQLQLLSIKDLLLLSYVTVN